MSEDVTIVDDPVGHRYELRVGGAVAGYVQYRRRPGLVAFIHTEISGDYEGRGLGSALVSSVLDTARAEGTAVLPFCPFVNAYMSRHPEYVDLVPAEFRAEFGL